jgi:hypothetical protein
MPLYSLPNMKEIIRIPHDQDNRPIIDRIPDSDLDAIVDEINRRVDAVVDSPEELITSGWIPGNYWIGTVWEPIYIAARNDFSRAGMVFGALVFEVMMNRPEDWSLGKYQVNGRDIGSTTYFRIFRRP